MPETENKPAIFVGYVPGVVTDPERFLERPQAPSNYGEDAAREYVETGKGKELWERACRDASFCKLTGRIERFTAIDPLRGRVLTKTEDAAINFANWLKTAGYDLANIVMFGFGIKEFLRVSGTELIVTTDEEIPLNYWYQHDDAYDPYEMLVESAQRKSLPAHKAFQLAGIECPPDWEPHVSDQQDAVLAYVTVLNLQLLPACVDSSKFQKMTLPEMTTPQVVKA